MTTDALKLMSSLIAYAGQEVAAGQFAPVCDLEPLVRAGWLVPVGLPETVSCEACDVIHPAEVIDRGLLPRALCRRSGDTFPVTAPVALFKVDGAAVARTLAGTLHLDGEVRTVKAIPSLWLLGGRRLRDTRVLFYFTPHLDRLDLATTIIDAVAAQSRASTAALIVASDTLDRIRLVAQRVSVLRLRDVARLDAEARIEVEEAVIIAAVLPAATDRRGRGAPASQRARLLPVFDAMAAEGLAIDGSNEFCRKVAERLESMEDGGEKPAKSTIRSAIKAWEKMKSGPTR